jgi:hypothetical protein
VLSQLLAIIAHGKVRHRFDELQSDLLQQRHHWRVCLDGVAAAEQDALERVSQPQAHLVRGGSQRHVHRRLLDGATEPADKKATTNAACRRTRIYTSRRRSPVCGLRARFPPAYTSFAIPNSHQIIMIQMRNDDSQCAHHLSPVKNALSVKVTSQQRLTT